MLTIPIEHFRYLRMSPEKAGAAFSTEQKHRKQASGEMLVSTSTYIRKGSAVQFSPSWIDIDIC